MKQEVGRNATGEPPTRGLKGYLLLGLAFVTCPCHIPVLLVLLAGTSLGAYLKENLVLSGITLTGVFIASLLLGLQWVGSGNGGSRK